MVQAYGFAALGSVPSALARFIGRGDAEGRVMSSPDKRADRLTQVRAQIDYHRQRLLLHQRLHGSGPSARLAELERAYLNATKRLAGEADDEVPERGSSARPL